MSAAVSRSSHDLLNKLSNDKVRLKFLVPVSVQSPSPTFLSSASNAIIIRFNVQQNARRRNSPEQDKVDIRLHSMIYELQDNQARHDRLA